MLFVLLLVSAASAHAQVILNASGWTEVTPSSDSRIIYVAQSGSNTLTGLSADQPVRTLAHAVTLLRDGYPDWLLLKAGDAWNEVFPNWGYEGKSGRSEQEPLLISSYGTGDRPIIRCNNGAHGLAKFSHTPRNHIFVIGIDFYSDQHDPASPSFDASTTESMGVFWLDDSEDLLFEDCRFRFLSGGLVIQENDTNYHIKNVRIRRCVITDSYAIDRGTGNFSSGYYLNLIDGVLVEENIFDHNGWNENVTGANATVFSHNSYTSECRNVVMRGNLYLRASSLSTKFRSDRTDGSVGIFVYNNFIYESEVGISIGKETVAPLRFRDVTIQGNVLLNISENNPTGRVLGWGLEIMDVANALVTDNLIVNQPTSNSYAIHLYRESNSGVTIRNNLMYRIGDHALWVEPQAAWSNIQFVNNVIQNPDLDALLTSHAGSFAAVAYSGNTYYAGPAATVLYRASNEPLTFAEWRADHEPNALWQQSTYPDPNRNLVTYQQSLGRTATVDAFMAAIRQQSKANWQPEYTAAAVNDYIRAGFGVAAVATPVPTTVSTPAPTPAATPAATPANTPAASPSESGLVLAYPNPAKNSVTFGAANLQVERLHVAVFNAAGEQLAALKANAPVVAWDCTTAAPGVYFYYATITEAGGKVSQQPVRKVAVVR